MADTSGVLAAVGCHDCGNRMVFDEAHNDGYRAYLAQWSELQHDGHRWFSEFAQPELVLFPLEVHGG